MSAEGIVEHEEPKSLRDDLVAAFAEAKAREPKEAAPEPKERVEAPEPVEAKESARSRDEQGRFAKGEKQKEEKSEIVEADPVTAPVTPSKPTFKAPDGWTAVMKARFAELPPEVQAEITRRETELTRKITSVDDERTFGRKLKDVAAPYQAVMAAEGANIDKAFGQFLNYAYIMRQGSPQQKMQALMSVAQTYGIQLNSPVSSPQGNVFMHPAINSLQERLDRMERDTQAKEAQRQQQETDELARQIDAFAQQPGHEHFEQVKPLMGALLSNGQAGTLQDAYEMAVWANPEIRSTLTVAKQAEQQQKQIEKAASAKKAAVSVSGGGPGNAKPASDPNENKSLRDTIKDAYRAATANRI